MGDPGGAPLVVLRGAAFGYGRTPVVSGVDVAVRPGDVVGVAGPNGGGKTTVLRGMLGLLAPLAGEVVRSGAPIGYVPQRDSVDAAFPVSVDDVVQLGAAARRTRLGGIRAADRALAADALERVGLAAKRRALFSTLSGGQRQRALFARALVERPRLLLLDEPTTGVDRGTVEVLIALIAELRADGVGVVFVSHELELLRATTADVLWVENGAARLRPADELPSPARAGLRGARAPGGER